MSWPVRRLISLIGRCRYDYNLACLCYRGGRRSADLVADMMRHVAVGALLACLGLCGALWWQSGAMSDLEAENSRLTRSVAALTMQADQSRLAADVAAARASRATQMTIEANATIEAIRNLQLGECADAQIDPDLAAILGRRDVPAED